MKQVKKLRDIAIIAAGQGAPQGDDNYCDNGTPFIKAGNLVELLNGKKESEVQKVSENVAKEYKLKLYPAGTVLFAKSGMSCMKGYVYQLKMPCYVVSHLACITPTEVAGEYLKFYFEYHRPNSLVKDEAYPSISLADIGDMNISLGTDIEQQEIVTRLNKISDIIRQRRQEIQKLEELVKSQFIEMFGDPEHNEKGFEISCLGEVCEVGSSKRIYQSELTEEGVEFLRVSDLTARIDGTPNCVNLYISEDTYASLHANGNVPCEGDVLVTSRGTLGRCYIVTPNDKFYFQDGMITWLSNLSSKITSLYIKHLFNTDGVRKQIAKLQAGSTVAYLSILMVKKLEITVPPIELQNEFARFVEQTDKSKVLILKNKILINRLVRVA